MTMTTADSPGRWHRFLSIAGAQGRAHKHWLWVMGPYLLVWWLPISWVWRLLLPGQAVPAGIDGPVSWMAPWWGDPTTLLAFQPLVPLGVITLIKAQQGRITQQWQMLRRIETVERRKRIGGGVGILGTGCLLLFLAHLVHLSALAVVSLQLIAVGIFYRIYGAAMLKTITIPLLFWLIMIPPPESVTGKAQEILRRSFAQASAFLLKGTGHPATSNGFTIASNDTSVEISNASSGASSLAAVAAFMLWYGLYRERRGVSLLSSVVLGSTIAILGNLTRVLVVVSLTPSSPHAAQYVNQMPPWWTTALVIGVALGIDRAWARYSNRLSVGLGAALRPVGITLTATTRRVDRTMDRSGQAAGRVGKVVLQIFNPLFWLMNQILKGIGNVFSIIDRSAGGVERGLRRLGKSRRRQDRW